MYAFNTLGLNHITYLYHSPLRTHAFNNFQIQQPLDCKYILILNSTLLKFNNLDFNNPWIHQCSDAKTLEFNNLEFYDI